MAKRYSNLYIGLFSAVMVIFVATLLALANGLLKEKQQENVRVEKIQQILDAIHVENTQDNAIGLYEEHLLREIMVDREGNVTHSYLPDGTFTTGSRRAFEVNMKTLARGIKDFDTGKADTIPDLPIFVMKGNNNNTFYVIPVNGKGLWGPIWGNIALKDDLNTIAGTTFDHKSETPGLGAEINQKPFQDQFIGKKLFNTEGDFMSIAVVKGGVKTLKPEKQIHGVDAISGGTITSNGVTEMLEDFLVHYVEFLKKGE